MKRLLVLVLMLTGCLATEVNIINDEIPCISTAHRIGLPWVESLYNSTKVDCSLNVEKIKTEAEAAAEEAKNDKPG